jgi:hypothetical protein
VIDPPFFRQEIIDKTLKEIGTGLDILAWVVSNKNLNEIEMGQGEGEPTTFLLEKLKTEVV